VPRLPSRLVIPSTRGTGFCDSVVRVCAMQATDRGLTDLMTMAQPTAEGA
jgi:hypothetical protein